MTAVVLVGDLPGTGVIQASMAVRATVPGSADHPAFIDLMAHAVRERSAVLVLCPAWQSAEAGKAVRLARGALDCDRIAFLPLNLPPLAMSLVADQVAFASSYVQPGVLAGLADRLAREVYAGAWVSSVAKLEHIETAFSLHVKSYLPGGGGFAVTAAPAPNVHRIGSAQPVPEIAQRPADPVIMLVSHADGDVDWVRGGLAPALAVASLTVVGPQPLSPRFWGTKKYAEFVAFSGHPQAMQATLARAGFRPCRWCGEANALAQCPFCWMVQPAADAAVPGPRQPRRTQERGTLAPQPHPVPRSSVPPRHPGPPPPLQRSWPNPARPVEAAVRPSRSGEANEPNGYEASPTRPRAPGTADPPPAAEAADPQPTDGRSTRTGRANSNGAVTPRPATHP